MSKYRAALLLFPLLLGASRPKTEPKAEPPSAATAAVLESADLEVKVELLDPGAEPRAPIQFRPTPGAVVTVEQAQDTTMTMKVNGQSMPMPGMGVITTLRTTVGQPDAAGTVEVTVEQVGTRAPPGADPRVAAMVSQAGVKSVVVIGGDGRMQGIKSLTLGDPAQQEMANALAKKLAESLDMYPVEPVGLGARFRSLVVMDLSGLTFEVEGTSVVTGRTADTVDFSTDMVIRASGAAQQLAGLPPGAQVSITSLTGTGKGTQRLHLGTLASEMDQTMTMDLALSMAAPSGENMAMQMSMAQTMSSKVVK